jgi:hypothetical protein
MPGRRSRSGENSAGAPHLTIPGVGRGWNPWLRRFRRHGVGPGWDFRDRVLKILFMTTLSLIVAVILFGAMDSSGVVDSGGVKLGGAFAGFIVTLAWLNRIWGPDDLMQQAEKAGTQIVYEEVLKTLDLRRAPPSADEQRARLNDYYRVIRTGGNRDFHMHYGTTGKEIVFDGSATHPSTSSWTPQPVDHETPHGEKLKKQYDLEVALTDVATGQPVPVSAQVTYVNGFKKPDGEWLETHVDEPTGRLSMLVLMPDNMQAVRAEPRVVKEGRNKPPNIPEPIIMHDGSVVYWSVDAPVQEARYALYWRWVPRVVIDDSSVSAKLTAGAKSQP